ncbi:TPA: RHS repeat-associated core domain-containing protein [Escherichia coli]|nr:RHS repeat-associated core domain-containing protein [Escherichia coli]
MKVTWSGGRSSLPADTDYPDPRGERDAEADPGLLYAGQWQDAESGLCYNRFRYYEPETGMYLVSDPLGLLGGEQTYRYVPNPSGYVDPLGLATCPILRQWALTNLEASQAARAASNFGKPLVQRNKTIGDKVRDMIAKERGTTLIEQNYRVTGGLKRIDVVDGVTGIESKVGRTGLTTRVRQEVARDIKILRSEQLDQIEWVFTRSSTTGKIGPTKPLEDLLNKHGIPIIYR